MSKHEKFIMTPITSVIEEMKMATSGMGAGIEMYSLSDYILQSTFTKMTGFQEQKVKCIDWELATNGYEYRRAFLENIKDKGTYSTYDSKNAVYNALINEIVRYSGKDRTELIKEFKNKKNIKPREIVQDILDGTNVIFCRQRDYNYFKKSDKVFKNQFFIIPQEKDNSVKLFETVLIEHYKDELYTQRNRIAHNTLSYQQNLPELRTLKDESEWSRNYFFWFAILVLIDEIFMEVYKEYNECLKGHTYFAD